MAKMHERTVLVTGAAGFVGQVLVRTLRAERPDARIVGVGRSALSGDGDCDEWHALDLSDTTSVQALIRAERPALVFHVAGLARGTDWDALYRANVQTTVALLEAVRDASSWCVCVIPGSAAEYGPVAADHLPVVEAEPLRPVSPYGVSKAWQTLAGLSYIASGLDVRIARLFNIIGPNLPDSFALGAFGRQLREIAEGHRPPVMSTGCLSSRRDFLDVRDVAVALVAVAESGAPGEAYNVCSGEGTSMQRCLDTLIEVSGLDVAVISESASDPSSILDSIGSNGRLTGEVGWRPTLTLHQSIADFWGGL